MIECVLATHGAPDVLAADEVSTRGMLAAAGHSD
jgi:hypothetical protein